jgi:hypothetical protein
MTRTAWLLARLYAWSLRLYPREYRLDYASELLTVFEMAVDEASTTGLNAVLWFGLRELSDMPGALLFQHRRERRNRKMERELYNSSLSEALTWKGAFISLVPMLLTIVWWVLIFELFKLINTASPNQPMVVRGILTIFLVFFPVVAGLAWGLAKGAPRWAYLHLGLVISFLGMLLFLGVAETSRLFEKPSAWTRWLYQVGPWVAFTIISVLLILLTRAWRPLRPFYQGFKGDWTLLSFSLSTSVIWLLLQDEIPTSFSWPYLLVGIMILFAGVLFYLRSSSPSTRIFVLLAALSLAMVVFGVGRSAYWGNMIYGEPRLIFSWETAWNVARDTLKNWVALMLLVSAPAFLGLVSRIRDKYKPDHIILGA